MSGQTVCRDGNLSKNKIGPHGTEALARALRRGALPQLDRLCLHGCHIGSQGMVALAKLVRRLPALRALYLGENDLTSEGFASLVADLGKDELKGLKHLHVHDNKLVDEDCANLIAALRAGALPTLMITSWGGTLASHAAVQAVKVALIELGRHEAVVSFNGYQAV